MALGFTVILKISADEETIIGRRLPVTWTKIRVQLLVINTQVINAQTRTRTKFYSVKQYSANFHSMERKNLPDPSRYTYVYHLPEVLAKYKGREVDYDAMDDTEKAFAYLLEEFCNVHGHLSSLRSRS